MMFDKITGSAPNLADQAAASADQAIRSTQRVANQALDGLSGGVQHLKEQASPLLDRATDQASTLAHRGVDAVREGTQQVRDQALRASRGTVDYIREEPVKSVLVAAAVGAALMAFFGLRSGASSRR